MFGNECVKCGRPAVVHLTEVTNADDGAKKIIQIDLCLEHAVQGGMVSAIAVQGQTAPGVITTKGPIISKTSAGKPGGKAGDLPEDGATENTSTCPNCGMTWEDFLKCGLLGCSNDYALFESRLLDLIKSSHEGATQAVGKTPPGVSVGETARRVAIARLEHELALALEGEKYEQAARLRDQIHDLTHAGSEAK